MTEPSFTPAHGSGSENTAVGDAEPTPDINSNDPEEDDRDQDTEYLFEEPTDNTQYPDDEDRVVLNMFEAHSSLCPEKQCGAQLIITYILTLP